MSKSPLEWQIAVFCHNERARIAACLRSISAAVGSRRARIALMINGSTDGSEAAARAVMPAIATPVEIFRITYADKSHAINSFIHDRQIRADAGMYFFVDAYVGIAPDALRAMERCIANRPGAVAATGIASTGRTEPKAHLAAIERGGVLHGQLFSLTSGFVNRMAAAGIRLPIGFYRGDGLLGSMAAHDLDPLRHRWTNERLVSVPEAQFATEPLSPLRVRDLHRQFRRKIRQMRGKLENAAVRQLIYRQGYSALPEFADDLIRDFLDTNPVPAVGLPDRPFMALALRQHRAATRPEAETLRAVRVA